MFHNNSTKKSIFLVLLMVLSIQSTGIVSAGEEGGEEEETVTGTLEAIEIAASFNSATEQTTLTWRNVAISDLQYTQAVSLLENIQASTYLIYRHESVMNESIILNLTPVLTVPACTAASFMQCSNESHPGHSVEIPIPPGVDQQYYYAIVTQCPAQTPGNAQNSDCPQGTLITTLGMNSSHLYNSILEKTEPIKSPYLLQANFDSQTSQTVLTWINYNDISTHDSLDEVGPNAFTIHVWRHSSQVTRDTGTDLLANSQPIANLTPNTNTYTVDVEHNTQFNKYYSVTYEIPNYFGAGLSYEDVRFHSYNTLEYPVIEDTSAPSSVTTVNANCECASSSWSTIDGFGNTSIQWTPRSEEDNESYEIWRSRTMFSSISDSGVELVGTYFAGEEDYTLEFNYMVPRGTLGDATYCVTVTDSRGIRNPSISEYNCDTVFEDMFSPWIAEPTNVDAEYIGNSTTRVSWIDQIGVEGETYHVWRSHQPITSSFWDSSGVLQTSAVTLVATVSDGIGVADVKLDFGDGMPSYYCVTTQARYNTIYGQHENVPSTYDSTAGTYEDFRLQQNCVVDGDGFSKPIVEDTDLPAKPQVSQPEMLGSFGVVEVDWDALTTESNENYFIYRNYEDPFSDNKRSNVTDAGWELIAGPIYGGETQTSYTELIELPDNHTKDAWYAVVVSDEFQNFNEEVTEGFNCYFVREDTAAPLINITFQGSTPNAFSVGNYRVILQLNEALGASTPTINISSSEGESFTEYTSVQTTYLNQLTYYFDMDIPQGTLPGDLVIEISATDPYSNTGTYKFSQWLIDAQEPEVFIYSPSPQAIYRFGDNIEIRGGATDDVGITNVQARFVRNIDASRVEEPWQNVIDVTTSDVVDNGITFQLDKSSTNFEIGRHKLEILVIDNAGNEVAYSVTFTVDNCQQSIDATTECEYARSLVPVEAVAPEKVKLTDPPYIIVFGLAGFNLLAFILMIAVLSVSSSAPKKGSDDEEDDDWMMEFIGTSAEPDMAEITSASVDKAPKALDDDDDDLFGEIKAEASSKKRKSKRRKEGADDKSSSKKRRTAKRKK